MSILLSRANSASPPTCGLPTLKSTPSDFPVEGEGVEAFVFVDMLATIAQDPASRGGEKSDGSSSDEPYESCLSSFVIPSGLPEPMTRLDVSFSTALNAGAPPTGPDAIPATGPGAAMLQTAPPMIGEMDATACFDDPVDFRAASSTMPEPKSKESLAKITGAYSSQSGGAAEQTANPDRAQADTARQTESSASDTGQEPTNAFAQRSVSATRPTSDTTTDMTPCTPTSAASRPMLALPIHVTALQTYLPPMIVHTALELAASIDHVERMTGGISPSAQPDTTRVKILTFDLHPAALGPLTVRMRIIGRQLEIAIDVRSEDVRATLTQTREAMVEALAGHGLRLESPDIRLTTSLPAVEAKPAMQDHSAKADTGGFMQDQGHAHHDRRNAWPRQPLPAEEQSQKARSGPLDAGERTGIYL